MVVVLSHERAHRLDSLGHIRKLPRNTNFHTYHEQCDEPGAQGTQVGCRYLSSLNTSYKDNSDSAGNGLTTIMETCLPDLLHSYTNP